MPESRDITVLIVDDDPVVTAALHAQVNRVLGFRVVGIAHSGHAALAAARKFAPRLILLDLHLPDLPGLEVATRLRRPDQPPADIIVISGRKESATLHAAIQRGAVNYLVKPTRAGTLEQALLRYATTARELESGGRFAEQKEIDRIFGLLHLGQGARPKNISAATEQKVLDALSASEEDMSAHELAPVIGVSRATARRYLEHLAERGLIEAHLQYGRTGRPQHRYRAR
ncbi:response regulator [Nonomuraea sp. SYSU D8015]|uniref:response regulator n=1 Tax=Nonomuraea sp. SYSU D8015 TaxID=2593644 RepID=UPI001660CBDC|nr:response regulator [Nonomuraea sp. SYSU D8015]